VVAVAEALVMVEVVAELLKVAVGKRKFLIKKNLFYQEN
jgi:hypothetical protein